MSFETALAENRRSYPRAEFNAFVKATRLYIESIGRGNLIDRRVAGGLYGLSDYLTVERKKVPDHVFAQLERLECLLFEGYDPHFDGHEPPGL
ncbi:MAG: hypothetical protein WB992_02315 [Bryobacteraceae bacterium]